MRVCAVFFAIGMRSAVFYDLPCYCFYKVVIVFCGLPFFTESDKRCVFFLLSFVKVVVPVYKVGNFYGNLLPFQVHRDFCFARFRVLFAETNALAVVHFVNAARTAAPADSVFFA